MFGILKWECIVHGIELENVKQDRKHCKRIERYEVSENAIYFEGKYLPVSQIKSMRSQPSAYRPHGCCGIGIPVFKIRVEYGAEKPLVLVIEQEEKVEELIDRESGHYPGILFEPPYRTETGEDFTAIILSGEELFIFLTIQNPCLPLKSISVGRD